MRTELTAQELETYHRDGFLVIPDFLDAAEVDELESAIRELLGTVGEGGFENPANGLHHHMNPFQQSARIRKFSTDPRIAQVTAQLEGISDVRLYQDMVAVKPAWGGPTGFHMDVPRISFTADHAVSYWFPLVDVTYDNAPLYYLPGAHAQKKADFHDTYAMGELHRVDPSWGDIQPVAALVPRGGVACHEGYAPHGTNGNMSPKARPAYVITHMPDGATFDGTPNLVQPGEMPVGAPLDDDERFPVVLRGGALV